MSSPNNGYQRSPFDDGDFAPPEKQSLLNSLVNLSIYGLIQMGRIAFFNPIHRVTHILNTEAELLRQGVLVAPLNGVVGCVKHLVTTEGATKSALRGSLSDALMSAPASLLEEIGGQVVSNSIHVYFGERLTSMPQVQLLSISLLGSAAAMLLCSPFNSPREIIKLKMHTDVVPNTDPLNVNVTHRFTGPISVVKEIVKKASWTRLFTGTTISVASLLAYRGTYYFTLNALIGQTQPTPLRLKAYTIFCTLLAGIANQPFDTVRQRMMVSVDGPKPYPSATNCVKTIVEDEGYSGLFRGLRFRLLLTAVNVVIIEVSQLLAV